MHEVVDFLVNTIGQMGYIGIFALMFLESSFFPFPSEVVMIPAGYLAYQGDMSLTLVLIFGILGSLAGAWFNYLLASRFGRRFLSKIMSDEKVEKLEGFFENHGHISTFTGRLIPGIRQYISFPAGLARMNALKFSVYTTLGAGIWASILTFLGYFLGANQELIHKYLREITIATIVLVIIIIAIYVKIKRKRAPQSETTDY
ncbi:MAG: DedA family protein [Sulfurospirillum sp.]